MPIYEYQCLCGVRFEKAVKVAQREASQKCPDCKADAPRALPSNVTGSFSQSAQGMGPQNTGVHDFDTFTDRVIGDHAAQGWGVIEDRVHRKRQVLAQHPDKTGYDLRREPDGDYGVLTPEERGVHDRAFEINRLAMQDRKEKAAEG